MTTMCEAELDPVLSTIKTLKHSGVWVEITNLVLQGYNDDEKMITAMCAWLGKEAGPDTPGSFFPFLSHVQTDRRIADTVKKP